MAGDGKWGLSSVWLAFALMFAGMSGFHFYWATQNAPQFTPPTRPYGAFAGAQIAGMDVDEPLKEFTAAYNVYIRSQNRSSHWQNIMFGCGYILACATAVFSFWLEMRQRNANDPPIQTYSGNKQRNGGPEANVANAVNQQDTEKAP